VFTGQSIAMAFFAAAAMFLALSLFGYTTRRDLTGMGTFLFVGLIAVVLASIVNIFLGSSMLQMLLSVVGVVVFAGLTAWDTQRLK
ncbi:Bax inhibitor-1 family protein, partial [Klebsiella michiganensis]|uniref:Bax inhibitor-1 family protein n=2 Tax=Pseudomonadota TaxID=1224 RepID=UPI0019547468